MNTLSLFDYTLLSRYKAHSVVGQVLQNWNFLGDFESKILDGSVNLNKKHLPFRENDLPESREHCV